MKKERKARAHSQQKDEVVKSRKQLRKEKKVLKKERKKHYYQSRAHYIPQADQSIQKEKKNKLTINQNNQKKQQNQEKMLKSKEKEKLKVNEQSMIKKKKKIQLQTEDDKLIKLYQQKLGVGKGKEKYTKIAKNLSFDDDIFEFLEGISKKVQEGHQYENNPSGEGEQEYQFQNDDQDEDESNIQNIEEEPQQILQQEVQNESNFQDSPHNENFDQQYDEMLDNLDQFDEENDQRSIEMPKEQDNNKKQPEKKKIRTDLKEHFEEDQLEIQKSMNRLLNKLSDGNVLFTFREFLTIFQNHSKSTSIPVYAQTFAKFNLLIQKPLFHILATNVALLVALHYALGNRLIAPVLYTFTQKYLALSNQPDNIIELEELGYSKKFQRLKNFATVVSLLYNYRSIGGQFIESYVTWLTKALNKNNIELIYIIIQKSGIKIRQNDPMILKNIINNIRTTIDSYKQKCTNDEELQKIKFIQMQLNEIRFNKKQQNSIDQRMAFLETFITKNVQKEIQKEKEFFPLNFEQLILADTSRTLWWENQSKQEGLVQQQKNDVQNDQQDNEFNKEKKQLLELAKSFHLVTEAKKNIFLCLMDSKDYLEATQRILELNVKHHQDIATVLVEICTLEPNFNPYYPLVAAKIANLIPKFRLNLQYAIWDHLKLIDQYSLRRTSNLAKFTGQLISDPLANSSLSILKFFPDLSNVRAIDTTFLSICLSYFFKKVKNDYLSKLVSKLREQNNRDVKLGIKEFLADFDCPENIKEKVKLCRRLLLIEKEEPRQEDEI